MEFLICLELLSLEIEILSSKLPQRLLLLTFSRTHYKFELTHIYLYRQADNLTEVDLGKFLEIWILSCHKLGIHSLVIQEMGIRPR